MSQKMCAKCGIIFEQQTTEKFCSKKCESGSKVSLLGYVKKQRH